MKTIKIASIIVVALIAIGCHKSEEILDSLTTFYYDPNYTIDVPATPIVASFPVDFLTPEMSTESDVAYSNNNTRRDLVKTIELTQLDLAVKSPEGGTLSFLKSVTIYVRAEGLPEVKIASKEQVPDNVGGTLDLDIVTADLTEYFKKDKYQLKVAVTTDEVVKEDYQVNAHANFRIKASLLN